MPSAARMSDMHICLKPGPGGVPHGGGPIAKPEGRTVNIEKMPAAVEGDKCPCPADPSDKIKKGSMTVNIDGSPAARMLDPTEHGGVVVQGALTVFIGG